MSTSLTNTLQLGVLEIGSFVGTFLFGVVFLQTFNYYNMYPEDGRMNKTLVATVLISEIVHTVGVNYEVYQTTILYCGRFDSPMRFRVIGAVSVFGAFITLLAQTFFALRLTKLLPQPYNKIGVVCIAISTVRFVGAFYLTVIAVISPNLADYRHKVSWLLLATFSVSAAVDVAIASSMLYYLAQKRSREMHRMSKLLDRLINYTVASGLLTSISAIALVICYKTMPNDIVWLAVYAIVAKLYSNSLLSALNIRKALREFEVNSPISDHVTPLSWVIRDSRSSCPVQSRNPMHN